MRPRDIVRLSLQASLGALVLAVAVGMLAFGFGDTQAGGGSFVGIVVLVVGVALLLGGLFLLGGAGFDTVWEKVQEWRGERP